MKLIFTRFKISNLYYITKKFHRKNSNIYESAIK